MGEFAIPNTTIANSDPLDAVLRSFSIELFTASPSGSSHLDTASNAPRIASVYAGLRACVPFLCPSAALGYCSNLSNSPTPNSSSFDQPKRRGRARRVTKARARSLRAGLPAIPRAARSRAASRERSTGTRSLAASEGAVSPSCRASSLAALSCDFPPSACRCD